jgi:hypothetical protein
MTEARLDPEPAFWNAQDGGAMALLMYDEVRGAEAPDEALLAFLESAYRIGAGRAGWDLDALATPWA